MVQDGDGRWMVMGWMVMVPGEWCDDDDGGDDGDDDDDDGVMVSDGQGW